MEKIIVKSVNNSNGMPTLETIVKSGTDRKEILLTIDTLVEVLATNKDFDVNLTTKDKVSIFFDELKKEYIKTHFKDGKNKRG